MKKLVGFVFLVLLLTAAQCSGGNAASAPKISVEDAWAPPENIPVPAGETVKLEPGGKHIMLINLKQELKPGDKISVTLNFEKSGAMTLDVPVKESGK